MNPGKIDVRERPGDIPVYRLILVNHYRGRAEKNHRYSLRAFAKSIHLNPGTLSRILNGRCVPSPQTGKKLVSYLGLSEREKDEFWASVWTATQMRILQSRTPERVLAQIRIRADDLDHARISRLIESARMKMKSEPIRGSQMLEVYITRVPSPEIE